MDAKIYSDFKEEFSALNPITTNKALAPSEMHQTKKGNKWRFGLKMHVGVDAGAGYVHTIEATSANEHDTTVASKLIREDDEVVYGDSGNIGIEKRREIQEFTALNFNMVILAAVINHKCQRRSL